MKSIQFFESFRWKNWFFWQEKCWYFWKMDSFSNTLNRFKSLNFAIVRGGPSPPRTPCGGRMIAFWWPSVPPNQNPLYATDLWLTSKFKLIRDVENRKSMLCFVKIASFPVFWRKAPWNYYLNTNTICINSGLSQVAEKG